MAKKLKNLKIRKVDFVDEGANPDAHIGMIKRKDGKEQTAGEDKEKSTGFWKRLLGFIGNAAGMDQGEIDSAVDAIQKGDSVSFSEKYSEAKNRKIADEIWDICWALQSSLCSILNDEDLDSTSAQTAMQESLDEFHAVVQESITQWSSGKTASIVKKLEEVSEAELAVMKSAAERLNEAIEKAAKDAESKEESEEDGSDNNENPKGDEEEMKIDKSKLTDAERVFLDSIEKRYGVEDQPAGGAPAAAPATAPATETPAVPSVEKSAPQTEVPAQTQAPEQQAAGDDGIYKGLHPAVKAELEELKKFREATEERELSQVAEKYVIIGKKKEELVPVLKSLKAAGGTAYSDMIAVLDQAVETVEKSGAFSEIGKSGHGSGTAGAVEAKVDAIAKGYMEKDSSLDYTAAMAKAWEDHPELVDEYEDEAGF
ncbi:MAG: hypothetical protein NC123_08905 [Butyrivibrio sp.]|nr:hypothetical protein [Butyrivibrio sp.]